MGSKATKVKTANRRRKGERNPKGGKERLRPGQLDGLVLGYMKKHKGELPVTATKVARAINRSSGAVGNCLGRLEATGKVRLAEKKTRRYELTN